MLKRFVAESQKTPKPEIEVTSEYGTTICRIKYPTATPRDRTDDDYYSDKDYNE